MESKKIILTLSGPVFDKLKSERDKFGYSTIQEIINELLRDKFFRESAPGVKKGRPRKIDGVDIVSRKKIFSKNGIPVAV
ncbi:hypothetical protein HOA55_01355 [archaeon]|jgi:hypothetical protein|nr:hypothetical protein [archaeon]MBT3578047.1 hypothetical protein [archaeon]MBT6819980.1 hypothetical protein [archaeon]MBT6956638.1 hypothetical protein [archaeon]MBT7025017.1 hypothetical protein [archaeon]